MRFSLSLSLSLSTYFDYMSYRKCTPNLEAFWRSWQYFRCSKNLPPPKWTGIFITVSTRARHWSLPWARRIQITPSHSNSLRWILMLSYHVLVSLPAVSFLQDFRSRILFALLISSIRSLYTVYLIVRNFFILTIFGEERKLWRFLYYIFPYPPVISSLLSPCSQNNYLCFSLSVRNQISYTFKTKSKIILHYIFILMLLDSRKRYWRGGTKHSQILICS
jgi:hypothetical protein